MSDLKTRALNYHEFPRPGKVSVESSKPCATQAELSLAYTPGVAEPVREIAKDPENAYRYTNKGNLVAVITDGTAILGLGNLGPLASKPVMEGKGVLFKRFADIDVFDIEVAAPSVASFIETVVNIAPTFGADVNTSNSDRRASIRPSVRPFQSPGRSQNTGRPGPPNSDSPRAVRSRSAGPGEPLLNSRTTGGCGPPMKCRKEGWPKVPEAKGRFAAWNRRDRSRRPRAGVNRTRREERRFARPLRQRIPNEGRRRTSAGPRRTSGSGGPMNPVDGSPDEHPRRSARNARCLVALETTIRKNE